MPHIQQTTTVAKSSTGKLVQAKVTDQGLQVSSEELMVALCDLIREQRITNAYLEQIVGEKLVGEDL